MKFKSKAHLAQELINGKKFVTRAGTVIHYNDEYSNPFRCEEDGMLGIWNLYNIDIWTEVVELRHIHQDLIDSYQEGQAWQFTIPNMDGRYANCTNQGVWIKPAWEEHVTYRLHPLNDFIQAHNSGAKIEYYVRGNWVVDADPDWYEYIQYRVKPVTQTVYEWMYKSKYDNKWLVEDVLMSEKEAKAQFHEREYQKTGRSWEV
jgi:hypothetical protein